MQWKDITKTKPDITRDEVVPTANSFAPLRCKRMSWYIREESKAQASVFFYPQVKKDFLTAIAPKRCNNEYEFPAKATCIGDLNQDVTTLFILYVMMN